MIKATIKKIDATLFGGNLHRLHVNRSYKKYLRSLNAGLGHRMIVHYRKSELNVLSELCDKYGSDKGEIKKTGHPYAWPSHTYADYYSLLFWHCRKDVKRVFECGLGTNNPDRGSSMGVGGKPGASLRVWRDYFPNAQVVGADVDTDILFEEERIQTFYVDQTSPAAIAELWSKVEPGGFDLMVDDGLHTFEAGVCLFENSISRLAENGIYIIEDVTFADMLGFVRFFDKLEYQVEFVALARPELQTFDNNLVVIKRG